MRIKVAEEMPLFWETYTHGIDNVSPRFQKKLLDLPPAVDNAQVIW